MTNQTDTSEATTVTFSIFCDHCGMMIEVVEQESGVCIECGCSWKVVY